MGQNCFSSLILLYVYRYSVSRSHATISPRMERLNRSLLPKVSFALEIAEVELFDAKAAKCELH